VAVVPPAAAAAPAVQGDVVMTDAPAAAPQQQH
jgi:hypothetical protein